MFAPWNSSCSKVLPVKSTLRPCSPCACTTVPPQFSTPTSFQLPPAKLMSSHWHCLKVLVPMLPPSKFARVKLQLTKVQPVIEMPLKSH